MEGIIPHGKEKILDDIAQLAGGTVNVIGGFGSSIREEIKSHINEIADRLDFVPREDFERLEMRVQALEEKMLNHNKKRDKK